MIPRIQASLKARIVDTLDDIPLDPSDAIATVTRLWNERISRAKPEDRQALEIYRERLCVQIRRVQAGELSSVVAISGIW